jgi:hypothetical protein
VLGGSISTLRFLLVGVTFFCASIHFVVAQPPSKDTEIDKAADLFGPVKADAKPAGKTEVKKSDKKDPDAKPADKKKSDDSDAPKKDAEESGEEAGDQKAVGAEEAEEGVAMAVLDANGMVPNDVKIQKAMKVETAFIRRACKLTEEQEQHIAGLDKAWVKKNVRAPGNQVVNGVVVFNGGNMANSSETVRRMVSKALAKELASVLTEDQKAAYSRETEIRETFEKDARIDAILIILDEKLFLRDDQRESLRKVLAKASLGEMEPINYLNNPQYLPTLPDAAIVKHLDAEQKRVYLGVQKVTFGTGEQDLPVIDR